MQISVSQTFILQTPLSIFPMRITTCHLFLCLFPAAQTLSSLDTEALDRMKHKVSIFCTGLRRGNCGFLPRFQLSALRYSLLQVLGEFMAHSSYLHDEGRHFLSPPLVKMAAWTEILRWVPAQPLRFQFVLLSHLHFHLLSRLPVFQTSGSSIKQKQQSHMNYVKVSTIA